MKITDIALLLVLAAIWGSSFIFMRATVEDFGPIFLITIRVAVAALALLGFLVIKRRFTEFLAHWKSLFIIGILNSALPFSFLAYASLYLNAGLVSILNATTPIFTAWIAHVWLKDKMTRLQFLGMIISLFGVAFLFWDKLSLEGSGSLPILAGILSSLMYGIAINSTKKYLKGVSPMTATAGSLFFAALFMIFLSVFFLPDFSTIPAMSWSYAIVLGVVCTALAYLIFFRLIHRIGPAKSVTVTFLVPIFSFLWAFLLLDEVVTLQMWISTGIILFGTGLVTGIVAKRS